MFVNLFGFFQVTYLRTTSFPGFLFCHLSKSAEDLKHIFLAG